MNKIIYDVLDKLEKASFKAYLVGGYVRDFLRKKDTNDIDICTNATPKEIIEIFKEENPVPLDYGNALLEKKDYIFEITTFRKDIKYINNRKPSQITYVDSLEEDLLRRDFTINTICMDKEEKIIDLLEGKKDLSRRIIKSVGDSDYKLKEDALRIMRAIRFATLLNFKLDKNLTTAIINNKELLKNLSYERKKEELSKIFMSENKKYGVSLLKNLKLLDVLELHNIENVLLTKDFIGIWSTITVNDNYPFTKVEKEVINDINCLIRENLNDQMILYKYGIYNISIVCDLKRLNKKKYLDRYNKLPIKGKNEILITAEEICQLLKTKPGPFLKEMNDDIERAILKKEIKNDSKEIKDYIMKKYL